jgi:hypothetical protein
MFILKFLPDGLFYFVLIAGIIGLVLLEFLPQIAYTKLLKIVAGILVVLSIYFIGTVHEKASWQAKVDELQLKIAEAEVASTKVNATIDTKVITKTNIIRERGNDTIRYIDREIVKYDTTCVIPKEFIAAHNKAATK